MTIYSKRVKKDDMKAFVIMAKDIYHKYNMYCPNNNMRIVIDFVDIDSGWKYGNVAYKSYLANGLGTRYQLDDGTTIGEEYN
ncbi:hypothetical protein [Methanothermococcus okinawensis]|nr:hypothetical protein [Methanothermococcus okinawensis]